MILLPLISLTGTGPQGWSDGVHTGLVLEERKKERNVFLPFCFMVFDAIWFQGFDGVVFKFVLKRDVLQRQLNTTLTTQFQVGDFLLRHNKALRRRQQTASCFVDGQLQSGVL